MSEISLFLIFLLVCVAYYFLDRRRKQKESESSHENEKKQMRNSSSRKNVDGCCGAHEVCEKESLLNTKLEPEYYDDEELDVFVGRLSDSYEEEEIAVFANVFYSLKEYDMAGWLKSLQLRNVELPDSLRDEALLVIQERRYKNK